MLQRKGQIGADIAVLANRSPRTGVLPRFSTLRYTDQIVVLDEGRVIKQGSHEELMRRCGRYARLFDLQARSYR